MHSPDSTSTISATPETTAEQLSPLEKLRDFNANEKSKNFKELAIQGIDTVKSFFRHVNIKNALRSFFKKDSTTETSHDTFTQDKAQNVSIKNSAQDPEKLQDTTTKSAEDYTVLKTLNGPGGTLMQSDISEYYRDNNMTSIHSYLIKKNIPKEKMDIAINRVLTHLSKKRVQEFKDSVANKLKNTILFKEEFAEFWAWRIANPPKEKPLLVRTNTEIKIKYDEFASDAALKKFLSNHISKLPDDFFDPLQNKSEMNTSSEDNIKTTADIEDAITHVMMENNVPTIDTESASETSPEQLAYDIEKQSNGWVDSTMYEKVASIPAGEALYMLGSINAELKPYTRKLLSEMRHLLNSQDTNQTFESLIQHILDTKNDNPPSEKTMKALSDIVNKLNKVAVLSEQN